MQTCQLLIKENLKTHGKNLEILEKVVRFYFSSGGAMNTDFALFVVHVVTTEDASFFSKRPSLKKWTNLIARDRFLPISQLIMAKMLDKVPTRFKKALTFPIEFPFHSTRPHFISE